MEIRDKLIDIIENTVGSVMANCPHSCDKCPHGNCEGKLADALIESGLIVQECNAKFNGISKDAYRRYECSVCGCEVTGCNYCPKCGRKVKK
jgi:hypothetical protein